MAIKLIKLRRERGISQEIAAHQMGLSQKGLSQMETGRRRNSSLKALIRASQFYGVSIDWLVENDIKDFL